MKLIELRGHEKPVNFVKFNQDGDLLFSGAAEKRVNVWRNHTFERIGSYKTQSAVKALDVTDDSQYLITGSLEGTLQVFLVDGGQSIGFYKTKYKCKYLELSQGNEYLLVLFESYDSQANNLVGIYKFKDFLQALKNANQKKIPDDSIPMYKTFNLNYTTNKIRYGYLNKCLYVGTTNGKLIKLDPEGKVILEIDAHQGETLSISYSKDYSLIATSGNDGAKFWDPSTLKCIRFIKQQVQMNSVAISPLITGETEDVKYHCIMGGGLPARESAGSKAGGYVIHLCNIMYGEDLGTISGCFGPINHLVFQPDGRGFVSAGEEGIIRCYRFDGTYWESETFQ
ncbi:eukaryotic translation initiation factor 3 subunit I (macronuclear) [Tetrahymena thermophila SB210]|uniref:Eukaryotic translation initiation factor 3 subunit I n=1 Tax=Tetrahymena thermophila (strain SB210) TaxID=312017 RepID=Q23KA8_TETTS|nr:eukaryotic translation initiation factor 3 subunit I [Tetrahymena thermophila SB210]EAR96935.1 eukaryotic translation initiation factor 3 subunit I [Tetrahymena thermophila SB210]|eukprot:XP_001017180.1 eukaryotic translation initiation factor 3 subunit I [Tetrahymena thermophila SB210]